MEEHPAGAPAKPRPRGRWGWWHAAFQIAILLLAGSTWWIGFKVWMALLYVLWGTWIVGLLLSAVDIWRKRPRGWVIARGAAWLALPLAAMKIGLVSACLDLAWHRQQWEAQARAFDPTRPEAVLPTGWYLGRESGPWFLVLPRHGQEGGAFHGFAWRADVEWPRHHLEAEVRRLECERQLTDRWWLVFGKR